MQNTIELKLNINTAEGLTSLKSIQNILQAVSKKMSAAGVSATEMGSSTEKAGAAAGSGFAGWLAKMKDGDHKVSTSCLISNY